MSDEHRDSALPRPGRASYRAQARRLAQEFLEYVQQQRDAGTALQHIELPPLRAEPLTDEQAQAILAQADKVFAPMPTSRPGNHAPRMKVTAEDREKAATLRANLLAPEKLPPGVEELIYAPTILERIKQGPATKATLATMLGITKQDAQSVLTYMLRTSQIAVIGHRKKNGNLITVYGLPDDTLPPYPLEPGDVEGLVARYLFRKRVAKFTEITAAISDHGDTAVMTALHSLMDTKVITREGKANQTVYVWNIH